MRRREFIAGLGSAATWPLAARAQQANVPIVGLLNGVSNEDYADRIAAIRDGLREQGYLEGQNVKVEYRSAEGKYDRLPILATELVRGHVAVIIALGTTISPKAARAATSSIPIVFTVGADPVVTGLVANIRRPESNLTGSTFATSSLAPKLIEIARELLPKAKSIGFLINRTNPFESDAVAGLTAAARTLECQLSVFGVSNVQEISVAFQSMEQQHVSPLIVSGDASLYTYRLQIVQLAAHHAIPTIYPVRGFVQAGGLIGYGVDFLDSYRWAGIYTGRLLKGGQPADMPIQLPTKFVLSLNLKTARALGLTIPETLLATADEVIQ